MTTNQIIAAETTDHLAYEATTIAAKIGNQSYTIADLRKTFDAVCNKADWKAPWAAAVPHQIVGVICKAVEWFHADTPQIAGIEQITGRVILHGRGYQA